MTFKITGDEPVTATIEAPTEGGPQTRTQATTSPEDQAKPSLMAHRREFKYLLDRTTRTALTRDLKGIMRADGYAGKDGSYRVRSIYFDTPDYKAYHDKLAGAAVRHKLRIRSYGDGPSQSAGIRLELKSRYLTMIRKNTIDVPWEHYEPLARAIATRVLPSRHLLGDGEDWAEFFRLRHKLNMEPKILIQYRREAFERTDMHRIRVNFDDELWATRNLDLTGPLRGAHRLLQYGHCIFELKVDGPLPFWMHVLIAKYGLRDQSVSKYCHAVRSQARLSSIGRVQDSC